MEPVSEAHVCPVDVYAYRQPLHVNTHKHAYTERQSRKALEETLVHLGVQQILYIQNGIM